MFCGKCGKKIEKNAKFCMACGQATIVKREEKKKDELNCKTCGTILKENAEFCIECGKPVKVEIGKIEQQPSGNTVDISLRERHGFTTFWIIGNLSVSSIFLIMTFFDEYSLLFTIITAIIGFIAGIIGNILLLLWKKIGFWVVVGSSILLSSGRIFFSLFFVDMHIGWLLSLLSSLIIPAAGSIIFWRILKLRKNGRSTWEQLS